MTLTHFPVLYDTRLPLFVYGTLRTGQYNWQHYLAGKTISERRAIAPRHVLHVIQYPMMYDGEGDVVGDLMEIKPELYADVMYHIDGLEEFNPRTGDGWYLRVVREVVVDGERTLAWLYHASPRVIAQCNATTHIPSGDWVAYLVSK